jgi:hypothetical protein
MACFTNRVCIEATVALSCSFISLLPTTTEHKIPSRGTIFVLMALTTSDGEVPSDGTAGPPREASMSTPPGSSSAIRQVTSVAHAQADPPWLVDFLDGVLETWD